MHLKLDHFRQLLPLPRNHILDQWESFENNVTWGAGVSQWQWSIIVNLMSCSLKNQLKVIDLRIFLEVSRTWIIMKIYHNLSSLALLLHTVIIQKEMEKWKDFFAVKPKLTILQAKLQPVEDQIKSYIYKKTPLQYLRWRLMVMTFSFHLSLKSLSGKKIKVHKGENGKIRL